MRQLERVVTGYKCHVIIFSELQTHGASPLFFEPKRKRFCAERVELHECIIYEC